MKIGEFVKKRIFTELFTIIFVLIAIVTTLSILSDTFFTAHNIFLALRNISTFGIMALGEALVILTCGIDLSVGSIYAVSGVVTALGMARYNLGIVPSICMGIAVGILIGVLNGTLVVKARLTPFVATFGMLSLIRGIGFAITGGYTIPITVKSFNKIGMGYLGRIPIPVIIFFVISIVFYVLLNRIGFGRAVYATGGSSMAAFFSGIKTDKIKFLAYVISGIMCAIAGIIGAAKTGVGYSTAGLGYELDVITAAVLGGVSLQEGGKGNIIGVVIGATIMGVIRNGLLILNVSAYYQTIIIGFVVIAVCSLDALRSRRRFAL